MQPNIVEFEEEDDDDQKPILCPPCLERGYKVLLGRKILMPREVRQSDYDQWLQCPQCFWICPIFEVEPEPEITNTLEIQETPFENKFQTVTIPKRTGKMLRKRKRKEHKDKDIALAIKSVGEDNVTIHQDTNP
jgi:hypothetical protein